MATYAIFYDHGVYEYGYATMEDAANELAGLTNPERFYIAECCPGSTAYCEDAEKGKCPFCDLGEQDPIDPQDIAAYDNEVDL